jgi:hypothetical protein
LASAAEDGVRAAFADQFRARDNRFGNARLARNLFERSIARLADRVVLLDAPTHEDLVTILPADVVPAQEGALLPR